MHFVTLKLSGFKSFVDATELHIRPGLTGVVGPNGCGKSNLLEALRWVMGETSAKSMRGGAMDDVIFAGAASRPPRNYAEVTLSIDNTERRAPSAFNDSDQLEISRRITRDLGSSYKHNGKEIRARDAHTLFADAATGANSPALVKQGQIAELINAKPKARRRVLEDAAGIAGLYARRHEATLRLNSAEANLERVLELLTQLEAREADLATEAKRAQDFRECAAELRRAEALLLFLRWKDADRDREAAARLIEETASQAAEAAQRASEAGRRRLALEEAAPGLREEEAIARALSQKLLHDRGALETRAQEAEQSARRVAESLRQLLLDQERERAVEIDARDTLDRLRADRDALAAPETDAAALEAAAAAVAEAEAERAHAEAALEQLTAGAAERAAAEAAARARQEGARADADRLGAEAAALETERQDAAATIAEKLETVEEAAAALETAEESVALAEQTLTEAENRRRLADERRRAAQSAFESADAATKTLVAERETLARLAPQATSDARPILEAVTVAPGFEAALGAALRDDLEAPDAESAGTAWGWRRLAPLDPPPALPTGAHPLAELVSGPPALTRRLGQIGLVSESDGPRLQSSLAPGQRLVSKGGAVWRWDGFATPAGLDSAAAAELTRANRLAALATEVDAAEAEREALAEAAENAEADRLEADAAEADARAERRAAEEARVAARRRYEAEETERARLDAQRAALADRATAKRQEADAAADRAAAAEADLRALAEAAAAAAGPETIDAAKAAAARARDALFAAQAERADLARRGAERANRLEALDADIAKWSRRLQSAERQSTTLAERAAAAEAEMETLAAAPEAFAEQAAALDAEVKAAETRLEKAVDALAAAESGLKEAAREEKEAERALAERREGRARHESRLEAAKQRVDELSAALDEAIHMSPARFAEKVATHLENPPKTKDLEQAIAHLKQRREAIGPVNLRAEIELAEVSERRAGLSREREELDRAIAKLRQGVQALNNEGRARLLAAFEQVSKNFTALFTHLFNGGDARLTLVDSDDPLEAGLEILCQPPGKRLSSLSLLSGGEQTLTAISLIFAVFMVNPAPICVLDEVDAPLDDANVTRFCDLLDEMTRRTATRFLIITHHPVTMSRVDRLFGVTMVEKGVSQLVSVDLERAVDMVEPKSAA